MAPNPGRGTGHDAFRPPPSDFGGLTTLGVACFSAIAFTIFCCPWRVSVMGIYAFFGGGGAFTGFG